MSASFLLNLHCAECGAILLDLRDSFEADQQVLSRLRDTAQATDRSLQDMRNAWLSSLGNLSDDEFRALERAHYPRSAEARARRLAHEAGTGHSVYGYGYLHGAPTILALGFRP